MAKGTRSADDWDDAVLGNFPPYRRHLIGVSGGRDSIALLHWLLAKGYEKLIVCHLDHRLRGRASAADARFVGRTAKAAGLVFVSAKADVRKLAKQSGQSLETAARAARYEFFASVARRRRCGTIFLGHHADDLVETFLINLFRGTGSKGQRSMQSVSQRVIRGTELIVVRPLLNVWRDEIDRFIAKHEWPFREDVTNASTAATRNRVRHQIVPFLEKEFGRTIRKSVWRAASIAAEENALLESLVSEDLREASKLTVKELRALPVALQRRVLRDWLRRHSVADIGFDLVESARGLLATNSRTAKINLPGGRHARRRAGNLFIE